MHFSLFNQINKVIIYACCWALLCFASDVWAGRATANHSSGVAVVHTQTLALSAQERQWQQQHPVVDVAVKSGWMPVSFKLENERHRGIAIDYLNHISAMTGLQWHMVDDHADMRTSQAQIISSVSSNMSLPAGYHRLPQPYLSIPYAVYTRHGSRMQWRIQQDLSALNDHKVAVFSNPTLNRWLKAHYPLIQLVQVDIADEAFEYLRLGRIDAYIGNEMVVDYHIEYHRLGFAEKSSYLPIQAEIYMAVADNAPELSSLLQKSLSAIGVNREDVLAHWRPRSDTNDAPMLAVLGIVSVMLLLVIYRLYRQRRTFQRREERSRQKIWHQANFDYLTDLPNRYFLQSALAQAIMHAQQRHTNVGLLLIDLDGFKDVNDIAGHAIGDKLLTMVAHRLKHCAPHAETTARLGGDEFVVLIPEFEDVNLLGFLSQKILQSLEKPYSIDGKLFYVTASIGIATYPEHSDNAESLLMHADQALFAAKHAGKNQYQFFTQTMLQAANDRIQLTTDLRAALHSDQFYMHYQPIFDLKHGTLIKAEALLRWKHPTRGEVRPDVFIKLAEESGFMTELGHRVLDLVLADLPVIHRVLGNRFMVGVNISPSQFLHPEYLLAFVDTLRQQQIPCQSICFEITEGLFLEPSAIVNETIRYLHQAGIKLSIDDFGTGYSALAYLKHYAIDYVKIDKSFVRSLSENRYDFMNRH